MKNLVKFSSILLLFVVVQSCTTEDDQLSKGKSSTRFRFTASDMSGSELVISDHAKLKINIETPDGEPVLSDVVVDFEESQGMYITEAVSLNPGEYVVTSFEVVDKSKLLYLVPDKSLRSAQVTNLLPVNFKVDREQAEVDLKVVSAEIAGLTNNLQIATYVPRSTGGWKLAMSTAYILDGPDTVATYDLPARINRVPFTLDPATTYTLVVIKPGYTRETRTFVYNDVWDSVVRMEMEPALTMLGYTLESYTTHFQFILESHPGELFIDWGDGSSETYEFTVTDWVTFDHEFAEDGNHFITVSGDLDQVYYYYSFYGQGMLDQINVEHLTALNEIRIGLTRGPKKIDLSQNLNIEDVRLLGIPQLKDVKLPPVNYIHHLDVSGPNLMNMPEVSGLVNNIYTNVVNHNTVGGYFNVSGSWWPEAPGALLFVGPPSAAAKLQLNKLESDYGWIVHPDF